MGVMPIEKGKSHDKIISVLNQVYVFNKQECLCDFALFVI